MKVEIDGLTVNIERWGSGPPVVLLHGFTGSAGGWADVASALAPEFEAIAIDIVGHGQSDAPEDVARYAMRRVVDDLAAVLQSLGHERATWLGYSMGGRTALQVAVHRPDVVSALILEGGTPGLATAEERAARVASDEVLAQKVLNEGVEAFVDFCRCSPRRSVCRRSVRTASAPDGCATAPSGWRTACAGWARARRRTCAIASRACGCRRS
jgi:2-succinyl-6-hydroxy-2,4-cyclohexadiene-1-carboxylate synthase